MNLLSFLRAAGYGIRDAWLYKRKSSHANKTLDKIAQGKHARD